jgi:hypothetical protein
VGAWHVHGLRDVQISPRGNLLVYDSGHEGKAGPFSTLEERDPATGRVVWEFRAKPPGSFYGSYEGNLQLLPGGHILYSVVMDELKGKDRRVIPDSEKEPWMDVQGMHRSFEITRAGKMVWSMVNDGSHLSGMPNVVRRLDLSDYLLRKGRY